MIVFLKGLPVPPPMFTDPVCWAPGGRVEVLHPKNLGVSHSCCCAGEELCHDSHNLLVLMGSAGRT